MDRLAYVIVFTGDLAGMRRFYEAGLGLAVREESSDWVGFDTAGATLALRATDDPNQRGVQLRFATVDLEARVRDLEQAGAQFDRPGIGRFPWGRVATLRDPEGNRFTLWQPAEPRLQGAGPGLSAVINCRDMGTQKSHYRDILGMPVTLDTEWWVQLSAGEAGLGLHPRTVGGEGHHERAITIGLGVRDLNAWYEERAARGIPFAAPPTDRGFGASVTTWDPDGNVVSIREAAEVETLEEQLAEPFEDDATPMRSGMRKPVRKGVKATSRVAIRPQYRSARPTARRRPGTTPAARVAAPRGTGPAGSRQKPKRRRDPKRARTKPALGRLRKAERRTFKSKKQAVAGASRSKPVKRASRARPAKRRAVGRVRGRR